MKGDHIKVYRTGYWHHGIDIGNDRVIHFTGNKEKGYSGLGTSDLVITETSIEDFSCNANVKTVKYSEKSNDAETTVEIAQSYLGKSGYSLFDNNCEHFARYCKTNEWKSEQVQENVSKLGVGIGSVVASKAVVETVAASGMVAGLSGPGIMSGLARIGSYAGGGAAAGLGMATLPTTILSNGAAQIIFADDEALSENERNARQAARISTAIASVSCVGGTFATLSAASGAGIVSSLATVGGTIGGGMVAGIALTTAASAAIPLTIGYAIYKLFSFWD